MNAKWKCQKSFSSIFWMLEEDPGSLEKMARGVLGSSSYLQAGARVRAPLSLVQPM